jgi:flagellar motor switch protein FliN/FliY
MANASALPNLDVLLDIPVRLSVELGACQMSMQDVLQLGPGSVVALDKPADAPVDLFVNSKLVARGEVVVTGERFGIRITEVIGRTSEGPASVQPVTAPVQPMAAPAPPVSPPRATAPTISLEGKQP